MHEPVGRFTFKQNRGGQGIEAMGALRGRATLERRRGFSHAERC
jgi:hypothetical protein